MTIRNQRGFTLVELLVGMAVFSLILAAVFGVLSTSVRAQFFGISQERSHTVARQVMQAVADELRYSTGQAIANGGRTITYQGVNVTDGAAYNGSIALADNGIVTISRNGAVTRTLGEGLIVIDATTPLFAHPLNFADQQYRVTVIARSQRGGVGSTTTLVTTVWTGPVIQ